MLRDHGRFIHAQTQLANMYFFGELILAGSSKGDLTLELSVRELSIHRGSCSFGEPLHLLHAGALKRQMLFPTSDKSRPVASDMLHCFLQPVPTASQHQVIHLRTLTSSSCCFRATYCKSSSSPDSLKPRFQGWRKCKPESPPKNFVENFTDQSVPQGSRFDLL